MMKKLGDLELFDVEDLAKILDIQKLTIRRMLKSGKLKGRKLAKKWYVTGEALREYFAKSEAEALDGSEGDHGHE